MSYITDDVGGRRSLDVSRGGDGGCLQVRGRVTRVAANARAPAGVQSLDSTRAGVLGRAWWREDEGARTRSGRRLRSFDRREVVVGLPMGWWERERKKVNKGLVFLAFYGDSLRKIKRKMRVNFSRVFFIEGDKYC